MMAKPMKTHELHYPMIQFLIIFDISQVIISHDIVLNRNAAPLSTYSSG